jgi:hypothetical protein
MSDLGIVAKGIAAVAAAAACILVSATSAAAAGCDTYAHSSGSPSGSGSYEDPYRTAQQALDALAPGGTVCLRSGAKFTADDEIRLQEPNITLTSAPGERAELKGRIYVTKEGDGATVSELDIDGRNSRDQALTINGDDVTISGNDYTNSHTGICIIVGSPDPQWGRAHDTVIEDNRIYDCGQLPATNSDHGVYVSAADRTVIRDNWIYDNADRGVQLYSDADHTLITANVIDGNGQGVIFGGDETTSDHNVVEHNVITNSKIRDNIESSWGDGGPGEGNVARDNCVGGGAYDDGDGGILEGAPNSVGFVATDNLITDDPGYLDRGGKNFELAPGSPCAEILAGAAGGAGASEGGEAEPGPGASDGGDSGGDGSPEAGEGGSGPEAGSTPPSSGTTDAGTGDSADRQLDRRLTIKAGKRRVRRHRRFRVRGIAPALSKVRVVGRSHGGWKTLREVNVSESGRYKARLRARGGAEGGCCQRLL